MVPLAFARAARRGLAINDDVHHYMKDMKGQLSQPQPFVLVSVRDLGLGRTQYSTIVRVARAQGYRLCPPEVAILLAADGPKFPVVTVAMWPHFKNGKGVLLKVTNMDTMAYIEVERFDARETEFSPLTVFAFLR